MPAALSPVVPAKTMQLGDNKVFSSRSVDLAALGRWASPILTLYHYRLSGAPFMPHPHAGFTAIAYVFDDSDTDLRTRDCLGNDLVTDAGGLLITETGSGLVHEDTPFELEREMHGLQLFLNHQQANKFRKPRIQQVLAADIPVWTSPAGDSVRVVLGEFGGLASPGELVETCMMLDARLSASITCPLAEGDNLVLFVTEGSANVTLGSESAMVGTDHAIGAGGGKGEVTVAAAGGLATVMIVAGGAIETPWIRHANAFIMNSQEEIAEAIARHERGEMGTLVPREVLS